MGEVVEWVTTALYGGVGVGVLGVVRWVLVSRSRYRRGLL